MKTIYTFLAENRKDIFTTIVIVALFLVTMKALGANFD